MQNTDAIWDHVDRHREDFIALSNRVFDTPETLYVEHKSFTEHKRMLGTQGFRITENAAGIPTAMISEVGDKGPITAFLGEFDALPCLSQAPGVVKQQPLE